MRRTILLMIGGLLGCATPPSAPTPERGAQQAPAVDIDALIARDRLTGEEVALVGTSYAELNGAAPPELIIHTRLIYGGAQPHNTLWLYDVSRAGDPRPIPVAPLGGWRAKRVHGGLSWGSTADGREPQIGDIDGDGRAEIVLAGGYVALLSVQGWGRDADGEGVIDRLWRAPGGVAAAVAADVDGDGRGELVSIIRSHGAGSPRAVALRPDSAGMWREVNAAPEVMLPAVLDALVLGRSGVSEGLPHVVTLMRAARLKPRDVAQLQPALEARVEALRVERGEHGSAQEALRWLADAMAWPGNTRAYEALLPYVRGAATLIVAEALLELDAQTKQTRGQAALLAELDELLVGEVDEEEGYGQHVMRFGGLLEVLERYEVAGAAVRLRAALEARELTVAQYEMAGEAMWRAGEQRGVAAALWRGDVEDEQLASLLSRLWSQIGEPDAARGGELAAWLPVFEVEVLRGWLARPALYGVAAQLALHKGDAGLRDEVWRRLDAERNGWTRANIFRAAERLSVPLPADKLVSSWLRAPSTDSRRALWRWAFKVGDAAQLKKMLAGGATAYELALMPPALYATGAACDVAPRGPRGCVTTRGMLAGELALLHKIAAAGLKSPDPGEAVAAMQVLGRLRDEPSRRLLVKFADTPGELQERAQYELFWSGHVSAADHIRSLLRSASLNQYSFGGLAGQLDEEGAGLLVGWLSGRDTALVSLAGPGALDALIASAPGVCAAELARLEELVDDARLSCEARGAAAAALALCGPSWLVEGMSDARLEVCDGGLLYALAVVSERGGAAHLPALERLAEDPRSRYVRERAHDAAAKIKARGARP